MIFFAFICNGNNQGEIGRDRTLLPAKKEQHEPATIYCFESLLFHFTDHRIIHTTNLKITCQQAVQSNEV